MIAILDYGMGNVGSIQNMLRKIGARSTVTNRLEEIEAADKLILPGVGAFDVAMENLQRGGFLPVLDHLVRERGRPVLGICLGMQLLTRGSDEGRLSGLGWIDAVTVRFEQPEGERLRLPHMGWNNVNVCRDNALLALEAEQRFYFVHSYYVRCHQPGDVVAVARYGTEFCAALERGNVYGTQFHPEKSHKYGLGVLTRFASL